MSTQDRNNFLWRPNDKSVTTNLRYDLEMNHWLKSMQSSSMKTMSGGGGGTSFIVIGLVIGLIINIILLILILISDFIVWIRNKFQEREVVRKPLPTDPIEDPVKANEFWNERGEEWENSS